jgi:hypothetical protein
MLYLAGRGGSLATLTGIGPSSVDSLIIILSDLFWADESTGDMFM